MDLFEKFKKPLACFYVAVCIDEYTTHAFHLALFKRKAKVYFFQMYFIKI